MTKMMIQVKKNPLFYSALSALRNFTDTDRLVCMEQKSKNPTRKTARPLRRVPSANVLLLLRPTARVSGQSDNTTVSFWSSTLLSFILSFLSHIAL